MARRLTKDEWAAARADWEADPKLTFGDLAKVVRISKQAVSKYATRNGWQKQGQLPDINQRAIRRADAETDPNKHVDEKPKKVDRASNVVEPTPSKREASKDEAVDKRTGVYVKHREEILRLDQMQGVSQQLYVTAVRSKDKDDWWRAKIASDTIREQVAASKLKQEMERKAWGLDVVIDPAQLRAMTDEQLQALADGRAH